MTVIGPGGPSRRRNEEALEAVLRRASRERDVPTFLAELIRALHAAYGAAGAAGWSLDPSRHGALTLQATAGIAEQATAELALAQEWVEDVLAGRDPLFLYDLDAGAPEPMARLQRHSIRAAAVLPLVGEEGPPGLILLLWDHPLAPGEDIGLRGFAERAAIALGLVRMLAAARESEDKYRSLMESAMDAIFLIEVESGDVAACNRRAEELTGARRDALVGRKAWELPGTGDGSVVKDLLQRAVTQGELMVRAVPFLRHNGGTLWMDLSAKLVKFGGRQVVQTVARDVTEIYWLQERLRQYAAELEKRVEEKTSELQRSQSHLVQSEKMAALGAIVAGVAHEINTPVGSIVSNAQTAGLCVRKIRDALDDPSAVPLRQARPELDKALRILEETGAVTRNACDRVKGIVQNLRNFVRLDEGQLKTVDIHQGLDSSLALVQHEYKDRIKVVRAYDDVPQVECHPDQINQVFINLLVNAAQAIPEKGEVHVRTFFQPPFVGIEVRDTGTGIPPEHIDRIFEPGFTTKPAGVGTGLGLSIAQQLVQDHCGTIAVRSTPGEGSTFTVLLPAKKC